MDGNYDNIEYRGRASTSEVTKEKMPASILYCNVCGKFYHLFFVAPYYVMQNGIDTFVREHRSCYVKKRV